MKIQQRRDARRERKHQQRQRAQAHPAQYDLDELYQTNPPILRVPALTDDDILWGIGNHAPADWDGVFPINPPVNLG